MRAYVVPIYAYSTCDRGRSYKYCADEYYRNSQRNVSLYVRRVLTFSTRAIVSRRDPFETFRARRPPPTAPARGKVSSPAEKNFFPSVAPSTTPTPSLPPPPTRKNKTKTRVTRVRGGGRFAIAVCTTQSVPRAPQITSARRPVPPPPRAGCSAFFSISIVFTLR